MDSFLDSIKYITDNFGTRITGTEADHKTCEYIEERFRSFSSNVETESFSVVGRALQNLTLFLVWGYFVSVLAYFFIPLVALILAILMLLTYYLARFKDKNLVNLLAKKSTTRNIIARFEPKEERKQIVIFSGHHDSAFHMPLFRYKTSIIVFIQNSALLGIVFLVVSAIWKTISFFAPVTGIYEIFSYSIGSLEVKWYLLPDLLFLFALVGLGFGFYFLANMVTNIPVMGANDNLTSVSMLFALGEHLKKNPPKNIEIRLISFGAEEPGLVGSKYYVDKRLAELKDAININYETLGSGNLGVIAKEKDNNIVHDNDFVIFLHDIAEKNGIDLPAKQIQFGNTDAGSFTKKGIKATTIFAFKRDDIFDLWHSTEDIVENLEEKPLQEAFDLTLKIIEDLDK
jgi:hypothetical protein